MSKRVNVVTRPRIHVLVNGERYPSAQSAFRKNRLPMGQLSRIRAALREEGKATVKTARKEVTFKVVRN